MLHLQLSDDASMSMEDGHLPLMDPQTGPHQAEIDLLKVSETRQLILKLLLHAADISNPGKTWRICRAWAYRVLNEFFAQGDMEKQLGIPVQMLNDRNKVNIPNSQLGFIEFVVSPLILGTVKLLPPLYDLSRNICENVCHWSDCLVEESELSEVELGKLQTRVDKLRTATEDAEVRLYFGNHDNQGYDRNQGELSGVEIIESSEGGGGPSGRGSGQSGMSRRRPSLGNN